MIRADLTAFLVDQLGEDLVAAFVYGSVAAGRAGPDSDIDCFVLTRRDLPADRRRQLDLDFSQLQRELGYSPDPEYPIEVFSRLACSMLLASDALACVLREASTGWLNPEAVVSDEVEVLRALLDRRLVLQPAAALDDLTDRARALVAAQPDAAVAALALGLVPDGIAR